MGDRGGRREFLAGLGLASAALAAAPAQAQSNDAAAQSLRAAFDAMVKALAEGQLEAFYGAMHPRFLMVDEDSPWRMDKAQFQDHISFHAGGVWEGFGWIPIDTRVRAFDATGAVMGTATFRGKPKDAGFRLRHLMYSQAWTRGADGAWKMLLWHQSPIVGHVTDGSPG